MTAVGIESINAYCGVACVDVLALTQHRGLDTSRFENLLMKEKTVALPNEDPVSFGVNAAKPLVDALSDKERERIELVIACTESSFDFGKSMATYLHHYLGLHRNCRLIELKSACYSGAAGLQMAANFILSQTSPGAKALVVATDLARLSATEMSQIAKAEASFAEPSSGAGAVAMLVSEQPHVFEIDVGASGYYGYEVMDTCRPIADGEEGDADLSLLSYLDCSEQAFLEYQRRVPGADYRSTFSYLVFHTPFGGMVKGAHRTLMRKLAKASREEVERDFTQRVNPGLTYCQQVGNIMGATMALSLLSTIDQGAFERTKRIGCFSYGSGCCSEFFSGTVGSDAQERTQRMQIDARLSGRVRLTMEQYDRLLVEHGKTKFGTRHYEAERNLVDATGPGSGRPLLLLSAIKNYHRQYRWLA